MVILKRKSYKLFINSFKLSKFFALYTLLLAMLNSQHFIKKIILSQAFTSLVFSRGIPSPVISLPFDFVPFGLETSARDAIWEAFPRCSGSHSLFHPQPSACRTLPQHTSITLCFLMLTLELSQPVLPILETQLRGHCQASSGSKHPSISSRGCNSAHTSISFGSFIVRFYWW